MKNSTDKFLMPDISWQKNNRHPFRPSVYKIVCDSGYYYVGCTRHLWSRCVAHRGLLVKGEHPVVKMNELFKSGQSFRVEVLEKLNINANLKKAENKYLIRCVGDSLCLNAVFKSVHRN